MLKTGKSIKINGDPFKGDNSILVSPQIKIHDLVLSANLPIPDKTIHFLNSKGANVEQIEEDGDKLVRLSGCFEITKKEVIDFLNTNSELNTNIAHEVPQANNFQNQLDLKIKYERAFTKMGVEIGQRLFESIPVARIDDSLVPIRGTIKTDHNMVVTTVQKTIATIETPGWSTEEDLTLTSKNEFKLEGGRCLSKGNSNFKASVISAEGKTLVDAPNIGYLSEFYSGKNTLFCVTNTCSLANAIVLVKEDLELIAKEGAVKLSQNPNKNICWLSSPLIPSLTFDYSAKRKVAESVNSTDSKKEVKKNSNN